MEAVMERFVNAPELHARFLNTLSYMENCGARKISRFEDPIYVTKDILDHAWEEKRHAYILKHQIGKVSSVELPDYRQSSLIGKCYSKHYLNKLDVRVSRHLKGSLGLEKGELRQAAYMLVTYAIEVRAIQIYPLYQKVLRRNHSPVSVHLIYREEEQHLQNITAMIEERLGNAAEPLMEMARGIEEKLFGEWVESLTDLFKNHVVS